MFRAWVAALAAGVVGVAVLVYAQEPQQPVFRGRIETVAVPVSVFDPENSLVTDLTREDFTILDNGKKRRSRRSRAACSPSMRSRSLTSARA